MKLYCITMFTQLDEKNKTEEDKEIERKEKAKQRRSRTNFRFEPSRAFQWMFARDFYFQFGAAECSGETV